MKSCNAVAERVMIMKENVFEKLGEECGVFGVSINETEAAGITYNGLLSLQHRGQEGAGIAVLNEQKITCVKNLGLVNEIFSDKILQNIPKSNVAIGHASYSTSKMNTKHTMQPFVTEYLTGRIATAHNGNIMNAEEIKSALQKKGVDFVSSNHCEIISALVAYKAVENHDIIKGIEKAAALLKGAFSLVFLTNDKKIIAVRDGFGFRPLCIGTSELGMVVASETCALDCIDFKFLRDVEPGELVVIEDGKITLSKKIIEAPRESLCIFEYVYFARPDSVVDGLSVHEARKNMGKQLAKEFPVEADVVCGVPDSGLEAAMGYAEESGLPLTTGFMKNRYVGRSFIYPVQSKRESVVKIKLNPLRVNVDGKRIVLVDDSIVRGTTSANIINALKNAGAKEVHVRISSPPFIHDCFFGTDISGEENLIANRLSLEKIREKIGADSLGFISVDGLREACKKSSRAFCTGCFTGDYGLDINKDIKIEL